MKNTFFILLLFFKALNTFAQVNTKIDSLKLELKKSKDDKFLDYRNIALFYYNTNDVKNTKKYSKIALDYAISKNNNSYIASAKILDSYNYELKADFKTAIKILNEAIYYAKKAKNIKVQVSIFYAINVICIGKGDFKNAILNLDEAIKLLNSINKKNEFDDNLAKYHLNKAYAYTKMSLFDLAKKEIFYVKKKYPNLKADSIVHLYDAEVDLCVTMKDYKGAIQLSNEMILYLKTNYYMAKEIVLIGCFFNLAVSYNELNDFKKSDYYLNLLLNFGNEKIDFAKSQLFLLKSRNKFLQKRYPEALVYSDSAIYFSKIRSDASTLGDSFGLKGQILSKQKKHPEAIIAFEMTKKIARENGMKLFEFGALENLMNSYLSTNQNQKALQNFKEYVALKDTLYNEQVAKSMTAAEVRYGTEIKEAQIKTQQLQIEQEKTNKYIAFGGIGVLMLLSGSGYYLSKNKQKTVALQNQNTLLNLQQNLNTMELQSLNKQLDPHEIKNLLASISPEIQDKAPEAYKNMLKLLNLTKASLNNSSITESVEKQVQQIDDFVTLEKNMLSEPLTFSIENNIKNQQTQIPRFLLKNLVENSIKHGIKGKENGGEIIVKLSENQHFIFMEVDDTGKGRKHAISQDSGIGTTTYQKLFATLNQRNQESATFEIIDKEQGTKVEVKIPTDYKYS